MAHDLRNPLAAVLANLNFLELTTGPDAGETLEAVADIKLSAEVLLRMIENLVTIARLEADLGTHAPPPSGPVDAAPAVRAAFERAAPTAQAAGVNLTL